LAIGELVAGTQLRMRDYAPSDAHGKQCVWVQCEATVNGKVCGKLTVMRVTAMTFEPYVDRRGKLRMPHRSCGCQAREAHRLFWERLAKKTDRQVRQDIWAAVVLAGGSVEDVAREFNKPRQVITTILRLRSRRSKTGRA